MPRNFIGLDFKVFPMFIPPFVLLCVLLLRHDNDGWYTPLTHNSCDQVMIHSKDVAEPLASDTVNEEVDAIFFAELLEEAAEFVERLPTRYSALFGFIQACSVPDMVPLLVDGDLVGLALRCATSCPIRRDGVLTASEHIYQ